MKNTCKSAVVIALSSLLLPFADAAQVIDQNSPGNIGRTLTGPTTVIQSFIQDANNISGAEIAVNLGNGNFPYAPPTAMNIKLWSGLPTTAGSTALSSAAGSYSVSAGFGVFKADWAPVATNAGQTYFLEFASTPTGNLTYFSVAASNYTFGDIYTNNANPLTYTAIFSGEDLNFKTFQDDQFASSVPEPSEWALLIVGLGMVGALARRRNKRES
jgi:hypothetical protein